MRFKNYLFLILSTVLISLTVIISNPALAGVGDTTVVQTLRYDTTMRAGVFNFPNDINKTYEKIIMLYSMRCKNGLVSTQALPNQGCGEWDYNCYTYVVDSSQTDSLRRFQNDHIISNFSDTVFYYTQLPVWSYIRYNQSEIIYGGIISQDSAIVGTGTSSMSPPLNSSSKISHSQFLWTASELSSAGLTAGNITGLRLDLQSLGSSLSNLRIKISTTTLSTLNPNSPVNSGFTEVYFLNTTLSSTGIHSFNFSTPFNWNGTSNIIVDFSFSNATTGTDNNVNCDNTGSNIGLVSSQNDSYLNANGSLSMINVNNTFFPAISNQVTIAFWAYGDASLPLNTTFMMGTDNANNRQINIHLPYSDANIYWDCGGDASGYDRINRLATTTNFKGRWNFWAFTKNATTGVMTIYLNGLSWATGTAKTKPIDLKKLVIGMSTAGTNMYRGNYDEISIWNKELSLSSIQQIMFNDITNAHPDYLNLLAYYKQNEGNGNIIHDSSPGLYDSQVINPGWRNHNGNSLFRNFTSTTYRPNATFVKGVYSSTVQTYPVLDSTLITPTSSVSFQLNNNTFVPLDTIFVWQAGYAYIYNEAGVKVDSIAIPTQDTIHVSFLAYYEKRPMKLELINFITPYGKGLSLDGLNGKTWSFDVTDFTPVLKGPIYLAMEDGKYQEDNDIRFIFYEGTPPRNVKSISQIWPNATWVAPSYNEIYTNQYFEPRNIALMPGATQFKIRSAISGHGQEGEFIPRQHTLRLNNSINFTRQVWKECADNPIYPQGGTWIYDRAGWCPGAAVDNKEFEITPNVTPGTVISLDYSLPALANPGASNYRVNNQLVSYGSANFTLDAAVNYIKTPTKGTEFQRINPICNSPIVSIKNTGSTTLTSLDITYGRVGGTMSVYHWTGSLAFLASAEVTLPAPNWLTSSTNKFIAFIGNPNMTVGPDQYAGNDTMVSSFDIPAVYPSGLVLELKTNYLYYQNTYTLKDSQGNILVSTTGFLSNDTIRDTVYLATDCYTLTLSDAGGDGLSFWNNPSQGSGNFYIRDVNTGIILKNFNPDFGNSVSQQFTVNFALPVNEVVASSIESFNVFPNPADNFVTTTFSLPINAVAKLKLMNMLGEQISAETIHVTNSIEKINFDISHVENGAYLMVIESGNSKKMQKLIIAR